jgi:hypothetical protein
MARRKSITKRVRFDVFKRDSFTCQYCGQKAPDVTLVIDHIQPVAKGGANEMINLITSCEACNSGKSDKVLSENATLAKQRSQLETLQTRREQLDMMLDWKRGLIELDACATDQLAAIWRQLTGVGLSEFGLAEIRKLVRKFGVAEVADAVRDASTQYLVAANGGYTQESFNRAFFAIERICAFKRVDAAKPYMKDVFYIRGILRNRLDYLVDWEARDLLEQAIVAGIEPDELKAHAKTVDDWGEWKDYVQSWIANYEWNTERAARLKQ